MANDALDFGGGAGTNTTRYHTLTGPALGGSGASWAVGFWIRAGGITGGSVFQYQVSSGGLGDPNSLQVFFGEASSGNPGEVLLRHRGGSGAEVTLESGDNTMTDGSDYLVVAQFNSSTGNLELYTVAESASVSAPNSTAAQSDPSLASATWDFGRRQDGNSARYSRYPIGEFFVLVGDRLTAGEVQTLAAGAHITAVKATRAVDLRFRGDNATETDLSGNGRDSTRNGTGYTLVTEFWPDSSGITGTATPTLAALTASSTGVLPIAGASSPTLAALTASSAAKLAIAGTSAPTLAALTVASAAKLAILGTSSPTLAALTVSSTGGAPALAGTLTATLAALTSSSTGVLPLVGSAAPTLAALTASAVGLLQIKGTSAPTLAALTASSTGVITLKGTATPTLADVTLTSAGSAPGSGTLAVTLGALTSAAAGKVAIVGVAAQTLGALTAVCAAQLRVDGVLSRTLDALALTSTGGAPSAAGTVVATLGALTASSTGAVRITGTFTATLDALTLTASGQSVVTGAVGAVLADCSLVAFGRSGEFVESAARTAHIEPQYRTVSMAAQQRLVSVAAADRLSQ